MPPSDGSLPRSLRWLTWSSVGLGAKGAAQLVVLAVLARYLNAEEFGVVTATLIVVGLGRTFTTSSIGPALVQREHLRGAHVRSAFALAVYTAVGMVIALWFLAPATEGFFGMVGLTQVMQALVLVFVLEAPGVVPEALLQRDLNLRGLAIAEASGSLLGFAPAGIGLAVADFGIWALVSAYVAQALVKSTVLVSLRKHERGLLLDGPATRELLFFSGGFLGARVCNYAAAQGPNFVVGKWMSAAHLGIYSRAHQLMTMPAMFLGEAIDRVLFPLMARYQSDVERLRKTYVRGVSLTASIMTPAAAVGTVLSPEIVRVVLGPDWDAAIVPCQVLMSGLLFRTGYKIADSLARATGRVYARLWRQAIFAVLVFTGALVGTQWGVEGVSVGVVGALASVYLLMASLSLSTTRLGWGRFFALHLRGLLIGSLFGALSLVTAWQLRSADAAPLVVLAAGTVVPCALFLAAVRWKPRPVMGEEGMWLVEKLTGRRA